VTPRAAPVRPPVLFHRLLGASYESLPPVIRAIHDAPASWTGRCEVTRGNGLLSRVVGQLMALPPAGRHERIRVDIESHGDGESWTRCIGAVRMRSLLRRDGAHLAESMGPATFRFLVESDGSRVAWRLRSVRALGLPLPTSLFAIEASESAEAGFYRFRVRAAIAGIGLLVAYDGILDSHAA
jgi:hypothetical protein